MPDCSIHAEPLRLLLARALAQHVSGLPDGRVDLREPGAVHALSRALAGAIEAQGEWPQALRAPAGRP